MYTAIVLCPKSRKALLVAAQRLKLDLNAEREYCHHCTLYIGRSDYSLEGELRTLTATHFGTNAYGTVSAFRVEGETSSCENKVPHIIAYTYKGGRPVEANNITIWHPLKNPIELFGMILTCK